MQPTCLVSLHPLRKTLPENFSPYIPPMAGCNSSCYPSWPYHSLAFAQQTNLPGHAGWLLRAGHCSVGALPVTALSGQTTLRPRHLPHLQTMCQGLPLLLRQFLPKNTPHLPEAPTLPQPTLHTTLLPQVHTDLVLMHFHLKTKQDQKKSPSKTPTKLHTTIAVAASFQFLHHLSPASQHTRRH